MKLALLCLLAAAHALAQTEPHSGRWDGTIAVHGLKVPFSMQLDFNAKEVSGTFVNGEERVTSAKGTFRDGVLNLTFPEGAVLEAKVANDTLAAAIAADGSAPTCGSGAVLHLRVGGRGRSRHIRRLGGQRIHLASPCSAQGSAVAHLLPPEDANGALTGRFDGLAFTLHHFDGTRASVLEVEPRPDGSLDLACASRARP